MKKIYAIILVFCILLSMVACGTEEQKVIEIMKDNRNLSAYDYSIMSLSGIDAEGRQLTAMDNKKDGTKYVGLFYSLWLGQHKNIQKDVYDITKLLETQEGTEKLEDLTNNGSAESPVNQFHFCAEPLYGYYNMRDEWVVTRHVELLTMAGIDYLCFDATNAIIYPEVGNLVLSTLLKYQQQGWNVPKAMFYTNSSSGVTATKIYNEYYQSGKYDDIWFAPNGKPRIVGITENNKKASDQLFNSYNESLFLTEQCQEYFDVLESQWPNGQHNDYGLPWMSWNYPQFVHKDSKSINVSIAQHDPNTVSFSSMGMQSSRGFDYTKGIVEEEYWKGRNFQNEWDVAFEREKEIENVLVTSWNEWMAIKQNWGGVALFCDVFNEEFSRDAEMMNGSCGDNFYMQLVENVRRFKYTEAKEYKLETNTMDTSTKDSLILWDYIKTAYKDFSGDAMARDYENATGTARYTDNSNRNDITDIKMTHDENNLYVYVKTVDSITEYNGTDKNYMTLFLGTKDKTKDFMGFNFVINRSPKNDGTTSIEKCKGGYDWETIDTANFVIYDNVMVYTIPLSSLGVNKDNISIDFKVSDNVTKFDDAMDYYVTGDSAPIGRLSYHYGK